MFTNWGIRIRFCPRHPADGSLSAQFEHTVLLTEEGPEILTLTKNGPQEVVRGEG